MNIIEQRSKIYGNFKDIAEVSQKIKDLYYLHNEQELDSVVNESIDMIIHKLSRIICGGSRYIDNYRDIIGYSQLVLNYLENQCDETIDSEVYYKEKIAGIWTAPKKDLK